ncbi:MAG: SMC family ATPase, partial [Clostridiales bacterium]|nr:SMC family ATPase [Clostridiales bacterium]
LAELKKNCDNLKKRADMYDRIAEITRGKAMLNYVAAEYIAEFTAIAGEILNDLSSGKYTMSYDKTNGFVVYDYLNEGKPRKTDTLSGGELFLASLSVAIAIARTQSRGNNAFFFLDEGFGTLDEDLIDVVYGALESLSKDCLVGVITHAEALISRMPFTVTVAEATDTCGSRIIQ